MTRLVRLPSRSVLRLTGADRVSFLNGLVSNDVSLAAPGRAVWAALLTPQGKYLADFFILAGDDALLLDCDAAQAVMLAQKLMRFRLRADVAIAAADLQVYVAWGGLAPQASIAAPQASIAAPQAGIAAPQAGIAAPEASMVAPDPRLPEAGWRVLSATSLTETASFDDWDQHRLLLGLPDGPRDLETEKSVLLEAGFDELGGICWTKGCYMGQELTARTRYRGLLKRRLFPVHGPALPPHGTPILQGEREVGEMRSANGTLGLALLRIDVVASPLDGLVVDVPEWVRLPGQEEQQVAG